MKRLPIVLSVAAFVIAVMGVTPLGEAARDALPFAKNADRVDMIHASKRAKAGQLYPLGKNAKFPASVLSVRRGPKGETGEMGLPGPRGPAGPAGVFSAKNITQVNGLSTYMAPEGGGDSVGNSLATCPAGGLAIAGGWDGEAQPPVDATVGFNKRYGWFSWGVIMANHASIAATYHAFVICAISGAAPTQQSIAPPAGVLEAVARDAAAVRSTIAASR